MDTMKICQHCGKPIGSNAIGGLCPECMMKVGLGSGVQSEATAGEKGPKPFTLPSIAEVTKHFPQLEILELLGQGGMGAVYKARQPALDRLVALKVLPLEGGADSGFAERFMREARALAKLSHPNIVAVHEFGQVDGLHYFIMEYVDGLNLRQLEQALKLSPRRALEIIPQICEALQFAHDEGVVHRDIKPENVLLDKKGRVKIADFGLAKILGLEPKDLRLTGAKDVMGTPHYMAPEQIEHPHEVDHRADIYSLGVVFYEMLTGELPLGKFQPPSRKVEVDVRLDEIVLHTLEKEPERRYQHASQVKTDLERVAAEDASPGLGSQVSAQAENAGRQVAPPLLRPAAQRLGPRDYRTAARVGLGLGLLILVAATVVTFLLPRSYHATARVKVERAAPVDSTPPYDPYFIQTEFEMIESSAVLERVIERLNLSERWGRRFGQGQKLESVESLSLLKSMTELHKIPNTSLIEIGCWSTSRDEAAEAANAIAESFVSVRNSPLVRLEIVDRAVTPVRPQRPNVPLNLLLGVVLGVGNGMLAGAFTLLGIFVWRRSRPTLAEPPAPGARKKETPGQTGVKAARWTARILGTLLLAFYGVFILGEGLPPMGSQPEGVQLNFLAFAVMFLGFVMGWKREGAAALLIGTGWVLWHVSEGRLKWNLFQTPVPVAALYAFCWWATRGRKTGVLVGAAITLAALLGLGRLFLPTNVFVQGTVTDAQTGRPVPNVEMKLSPRTARASGKSHAPGARSANDGRFRLYVSWYAEAKQVDILAPGYFPLRTNLGPRGLGQRAVRRDFQLLPAQAASLESAVPPVVIATIPESGAADVDPALTELRVTFSQPMRDRSWSWTKWGEEHFPELTGQPGFDADRRTCALPVKLQPGKVYATWINSDHHKNFTDTGGRPAVPYLLIFQTSESRESQVQHTQ